MNKEKNNQFLGLGSMIEVDDVEALPETKYVIIARAVKKGDNDEIILRYRIAPHPTGSTSNNAHELLTINEDKITKVHTAGYTDKSDEAFLIEVVTGLDNNNASGELKKQNMTGTDKTNETEMGGILSALVDQEQQAKETALLKKDPFYKFRKGA